MDCGADVGDAAVEMVDVEERVVIAFDKEVET